MKNNELTDRILKASERKNDKLILKCSIALEFAKELKINPGKIKKICDENNIRLQNCQLGCF